MGVTDPIAGRTGREPGASGRQQHRHYQHGRGADRQAAGVSQGSAAQDFPRRVLWDPQAPGSVPQWKGSQEPAKELNLQLYSMEVSSVDNYDAAFKKAIEARNSAVWVTLNPLANSNQKLIAELAIKNRLPSICARGDYAENGCLLSYGPSYSIEGRDGALFVDKISRAPGRPICRCSSRPNSNW
jgi:hypothetical protein